MKKKRRGEAARRHGGGRAWGSGADVHRVHFDGGCAPVNPGGIATFGWRFVGPDGRVLASDHGEVCRGPGATNNVAEWQALLRALLFLANGGTLRDWLAARPGSLLDRLNAQKDASAIADELYLSVLTRMPTAEERKEVADYLARRNAERPAALQDLAWALLTSAEFRFNH